MKTKLLSLSALFAFVGLTLSATVHNVTVSSNVFTPANLTITAGDTVIWTNTGGSHNVNGTTATYSNNPESFGNGGPSSASWTYQHVFTIPGNYDYQCDPHVGAGMTGTITVQQASSSPVVLHCWDFNGTAPGGNFSTSPLNTDNRVAGNGTITHNLTDAEDFGGDSDNACMGSAAGAAFCPRGGSSQVNNGNHFTLEFPTDGHEDVELSFYAQRTGTGFDTNTVQYSADAGMSFQTLATFDPSSSVETFLLDTIPAVNDNPDFQIRIVLGGASSAAGNNRYDNIKLTATPTSGGGTGGPQIPHYDIADVTTNDASGVADSLGVSMALRGLVSSINFRSGGYEFFFYDATGGIATFASNNDGSYTNPQMGDSITAYGSIGQFRGLTQLNIDSVELHSTGNAIKNPALVSDLDETTEGEYLRIDSVTLADPSQWPASGSANVDIVKDNDTLTMRINGATTIPGSPAPSGPFDVIGHGSQFTFASNLDDGYQILPGDTSDIIFSAPPSGPATIPSYDIADVRSLDSNGEPDSLSVNVKLTGIVYTDDFRGTGHSFYMYDTTAGINVFSFSDVDNYNAQRGDSIRVIGRIDFYNGLTEIVPDSIVVLGNTSLRSPNVVAGLDESTEGDYIRLNGYYLADASQWPANSSSSVNIDITNGLDTLTMRMDASTGIADSIGAPTGYFDVIGAGSQFDGSAPYFSGYQIFPRDAADIIPAQLPKLAISEVMAHSQLSSALDGAWFEVYNYGTTSVNIQDFSWDDDGRQPGQNTVTGNVSIPAGERALFLEIPTADVTDWEIEWLQDGNNLLILNEGNQIDGFSSLSTSGDEVNLYDQEGRLISAVSYADTNQQNGYSLEYDTTGSLLGNSSVGVRGAYSSQNGDVGSPGNEQPISLTEFMKGQLDIYPNPAHQSFFIESEASEQKEIIVTDMSGAQVLSLRSEEQTVRVDVSHLPKGVYIVSLHARGQSATQKLIIQ